MTSISASSTVAAASAPRPAAAIAAKVNDGDADDFVKAATAAPATKLAAFGPGQLVNKLA